MDEVLQKIETSVKPYRVEIVVRTHRDATCVVSQLAELKRIRKAAEDWFAPLKQAAQNALNEVRDREKAILSEVDEAISMRKEALRRWLETPTGETAVISEEADAEAGRMLGNGKFALLVPSLSNRLPDGVSIRKTRRAVVTDIVALAGAVVDGDVPEDVLSVNQSRLNDYARRNGWKEIPGVRIEEETTLVVKEG